MPSFFCIAPELFPSKNDLYSEFGSKKPRTQNFDAHVCIEFKLNVTQYAHYFESVYEYCKSIFFMCRQFENALLLLPRLSCLRIHGLKNLEVCDFAIIAKHASLQGLSINAHHCSVEAMSDLFKIWQLEDLVIESLSIWPKDIPYWSGKVIAKSSKSMSMAKIHAKFLARILLRLNLGGCVYLQPYPCFILI